MEQSLDNQDEYVRQVLDAYRKTPGTMGTLRRPDRLLAAQLHQRGVPLAVVENALVLAAARRLIRPTDALPLGTIRSLAYFLPVIDEVLGLHVNPDYFHYLRQRSNAPAEPVKPQPGPSRSDPYHPSPARLRRG